MKKKRGYQSSSLIPLLRLWYAYLPRISNAEPTLCHVLTDVHRGTPLQYALNGHWLLLYRAVGCEFTRFQQPQIKRFAQRLSLYVSVAHPLTRQGLGWLTMQIYKKMPTLQEIQLFFLKIRPQGLRHLYAPWPGLLCGVS